MKTPKIGLSIVNADFALSAQPTRKTLRIAKTLGYAAILHDNSEAGRGTGAETSVINHAEAARLAYHTAPLVEGTAVTIAEIGELAATLPKPVLIVSADSARGSAIVAAASEPDGHLMPEAPQAA